MGHSTPSLPPPTSTLPTAKQLSTYSLALYVILHIVVCSAVHDVGPVTIFDGMSHRN
jgi:hypothetical protein